MKLNQDKLYKVFGAWWAIDSINGYLIEQNIDGPYCLNCYVDLNFPESTYNEFYDYHQISQFWTGLLECSNCQKNYNLEIPLSDLKDLVKRKFVSQVRALIQKESLEEPPTNVKVRDHDDKYFIAAKIGEKDGRRVGVVYFGEKNKEQSKEDYAQIFIDLDDEQVRFDKSNKSPKDIIAKMKVEFPESIHEETYTKSKK